jgi:acetyl esterase/lipase
MPRSLALPILFLLSAVAAVPAAAPPAVRPAIRQALDVHYYPGNGRQTLDVFAPALSDKRPLPVVVFVHGGTWIAGDKNHFGLNRGVGRFLARHGVVAVLINYRLSPGVKHPEHARDVARAYAWTCRNVARYGGDPTRIVLAGHSAGAHLACLVATDKTYLDDPELKLTDRDRDALRGVVGVSGVYRIPPPEEFRKMSAAIVDHLVSRAAPKKLAGVLTPVLLRAGESLNPFALVFGSDSEVQKQASPLYHVRKGLPPFLLLYADREVPGLAMMAEDFAAALRKAGDPVVLKEIPGCTHRSIVVQMHDNREEAGKLFLDFISRYTSSAADHAARGSSGTTHGTDGGS